MICNTASRAPAHPTVLLIQTREILVATAGGDLLRGSLAGVIWGLRCIWSLVRSFSWWRGFLLDWILWGYEWIFLGFSRLVLAFLWWFVLCEVVHWLESQKCYTHALTVRLPLFCFQGTVGLKKPPANDQTSPLHTNAGQALCDAWRSAAALWEAPCQDAGSRQK